MKKWVVGWMKVDIEGDWGCGGIPGQLEFDTEEEARKFAHSLETQMNRKFVGVKEVEVEPKPPVERYSVHRERGTWRQFHRKYA
ncbi:MAG: hypothetical protein GDA52_03670 [Rhodobacteraceae bacterium]|nr:hypothetical protein [Paracoccaceae bacterium]